MQCLSYIKKSRISEEENSAAVTAIPVRQNRRKARKGAVPMTDINEARKMSYSRIETSMIMLPGQANSLGNVHGGEMMKLMDNVAGMAAMKHAGGIAVTARVDELVFHEPVNIGDIVTCIGQVAYVGRTSMQVKVTVYIHSLNRYSEPKIALSSFFTMVHLGEDNQPKAVPRLIAVTDEEKELYRLGEKKYRKI